MHGLAGLTRWNRAMMPDVLDMLRILSRSGTPAMRARGRILLKRLEAGKEPPRITGEIPQSFMPAEISRSSSEKAKLSGKPLRIQGKSIQALRSG